VTFETGSLREMALADGKHLICQMPTKQLVLTLRDEPTGQHRFAKICC
jgi:hypothetical protein